MIKSMTGYGKGESADPQGRCLVEIRPSITAMGRCRSRCRACSGYNMRCVRRSAAWKSVVRRSVVQWEPAAGVVVVPPLITLLPGDIISLELPEFDVSAEFRCSLLLVNAMC